MDETRQSIEVVFKSFEMCYNGVFEGL